MKRRFGWVLPVLIALTVVLAAYTIAAAVLLRGLGAYRMGTGLGQVLAVSRPYTLAAAVVLAAGLLIRLALRRRKKAKEAARQDKVAPAAATELMPGNAGKKIAPARPVPEKKPARKGKKVQPVEKLAPSAAELGGADKIAPAGKIAPAAPTVPMAQAAKAEEKPAPAATVLMPEAAAKREEKPAPAATELMPETAPAKLPTAGPRVCAVCGAPLKAGQKFCVKCGAQAPEGGAV